MEAMQTKKYFSRILMLFGIMGLTACSSGGSSDEEDVEKSTETIVALSAQSIAANEEVDASTTKKLILTFGSSSLTRGSGDITLNGTAVNASVSTTAVNQVVIDLDLEEGKSYAFIMPKGAFVKKTDANAKTAAVSFSFKTKEKKVVTYNFDAITNSSATAATKKVYQFLLDNYGKTMLSGAMGGVAWENGFADFINTTTGKYPAIVGYDYIHMPYSSASSWINYGNITPVQSAWNAGSIIQIGWHWRAPSSADESSDKWDFYKSGTSFNVINALTPDTWEKTFLDKDIATLAGYLKLLQDAGIPVLFRPLHEAAGDYQWGGWFWWGAKGADACKRLWKYLHDELTNTYGLNNLIWVWTVQTGTGGSLAAVSDLQFWYPGDGYVDIVGADLYFDANGKNGSTTPYTNQQAYDLVMESVNGKKMVVMSECGRLPVASECLAAGQNWGYFMTWYGTQSGNTWSLASDWDSSSAFKTKMNDRCVSNRGDFSVK